MRTQSTLSILVVSLLGCGGAQPAVSNHEAPPDEASHQAEPAPVLVSDAFQHDAMQLQPVGTLDPATRIVMGEQTIEGHGDGTFTFSEGEFSAPVPPRWVENILTSLQPPLLGLACPPARARRGEAEAPQPSYTITSGGVTSTFIEGCTARRTRPADLAVAASDVVGRISQVARMAARFELIRQHAVGQPIPDAQFTFITDEIDNGPEAPEEGNPYHRRIAMNGDHFELCTLTVSDPEATGPDNCFAVSNTFVAALARTLREEHCVSSTIDASCGVFDNVRRALENAIEWSPGFDLTGIGTQP